MKKPDKTEYPAHYQVYIDQTPDSDILRYLLDQLEEVKSFFENIPTQKLSYRYTEGKWSIIEILGHVIETERIFAYRALRFSKNDRTPLPSFDENEFMVNSVYDSVKLETLLEEFDLVRKANLIMFGNFTEQMWTLKGNASGNMMSVRAVPFILAGHLNHHLNVIRNRYLV